MEIQNQLEVFSKLLAPTYDDADSKEKWMHVLYVSNQLQVFAPHAISHVFPHALKKLADDDGIKYIEEVKGEVYFPVQWLASVDSTCTVISQTILEIVHYKKNSIEGQFVAGAVIH